MVIKQSSKSLLIVARWVLMGSVIVVNIKAPLPNHLILTSRQIFGGSLLIQRNICAKPAVERSQFTFELCWSSSQSSYVIQAGPLPIRPELRSIDSGLHDKNWEQTGRLPSSVKWRCLRWGGGLGGNGVDNGLKWSGQLVVTR